MGIGLVAASLGWAAWLLRDRPISEEVELLPGTVLPSSELAIVEAAFDRAQLTGHRTEAGRVWVPRPRQSAYMRALVDAEALPREFGSSLRRALENNSPWQSRAVQEEMLRVAVQEELAHVICSMPGIERAAVLYAGDDRPSGSLGAAPLPTASVNVRTQPGAELEPARVQAIRVLVAASISGLQAERVAVTDLRSGRVFVGPLPADPGRDDVAAADPALARRIVHERHLAGKLRQGLAFVEGAIVDVTVTFQNPAPPRLPAAVSPPSSQRIADANAPAEVGDPITEENAFVDLPEQPSPEVDEGFPATILVSLAVPEPFFVAARGRAGSAVDPAGVDRVTEQGLRDHVLGLLPPTTRADGRQVLLTRFPVTGSVAAEPAGRRRDRGLGSAAPQDARGGVARGRVAGDPRRPCRGRASRTLARRDRRRRRPARLARAPSSAKPVPAPVGPSPGAPDRLVRGRGRAAGRAGRSPEAGRGMTISSASAPGLARAATAAVRITTTVAVWVVAIAAVVAADAPVPPSPDEAAELQPVAFAAAADRPPASAPLPLTGGPKAERPASTGGSPLRPLGDWTVLLAIAAAFALVAAFRITSLRRTKSLPPDVFELLGEATLGGQQTVRVVRFGPRTLLIGVSPSGCQTLAELDDPQATERIATACRSDVASARVALRTPRVPPAKPAEGEAA
ncbi:MAG: hypothetical protein EBX36_08660 [Planctomycetia bacterium]|nr:hypothetical protein [Planctomycetia bacterium]